ncbi:MAG: hypothetical protein MI923_19370 [Phycisphaerales bacterium]|nr:hypothetical protein [Phycisphaerales bacterium]
MRKEQSDSQNDTERRDVYREAVREGAGVAIRSACIWLPIGAAILLAGLYAEKRPFIAAQEVLVGGDSDFWQEAFMPVVLFAMFGGCFGLFFGWRMTTASGLIGPPALFIGVAVVLILAVIGSIGALLIFTGGIPLLVWISLGATTLVAIGGITFFTIWGQ